MKIIKMLIMTSASAALMLSPVYGASDTEAYKKLESSIVETEPLKEGYQYYIAADDKGYDWHGIFDNEGNIIAMAATFYDRGEAEEAADCYGEKIYYKVPMEYRDGADFYQVIIPVKKGTEIEVLCARPANLYEDGYKVIKNWDMSEDGDVIILRTNLTPSYMVRIKQGENAGYLRWSQDWYPEEAVEGWNDDMEIPLP